MNDFEATLLKFSNEAEEIKRREAQLRTDQQLHFQKWQGFLKENGLQDTFTLPELAILAVRKSRELILP